jgi:hypothetical protein
MYEYADAGGCEREYFPEARQLECFDLFLTMVVFEVCGEFYDDDFKEQLAEAVAKLREGVR